MALLRCKHNNPKRNCAKCEREEIKDLAIKLETLEEAYRILEEEWMMMYAGRKCPNCGYHVTMNGEE